MNPERAEQLLYESEATLRLVDSLLGELQDMESQLNESGLGKQALQLVPEAESDTEQEIPELLAEAAAEARALLETLTRSRLVFERTSQELHARNSEPRREVPTSVEIRGGLERALLLIDRLEGENDSPSLQKQLREEILDLLDGVVVQGITEQRLSYASSVLRDTETQLSNLVQRLSARPGLMLRFSGGWATS